MTVSHLITVLCRRIFLKLNTSTNNTWMSSMRAFSGILPNRQIAQNCSILYQVVYWAVSTWQWVLKMRCSKWSFLGKDDLMTSYSWYLHNDARCQGAQPGRVGGDTLGTPYSSMVTRSCVLSDDWFPGTSTSNSEISNQTQGKITSISKTTLIIELRGSRFSQFFYTITTALHCLLTGKFLC